MESMVLLFSVLFVFAVGYLAIFAMLPTKKHKGKKKCGKRRR